MTNEEAALLETLRLAKNKAASLLNSQPSQETKKAYVLACKAHDGYRLKVDPVARAANTLSSKKSHERAKLGIFKAQLKK